MPFNFYTAKLGDFQKLNIERKVFTGQRMIPIQSHFGLSQTNDCEFHSLTIWQITKAPDDMSEALFMPESDGAPARTRTGAPGLGNRCSIRLSYRGA